ncbi:MAG: hypothetical protein H7A21_00180 [Spirochaetales bacterium]|nr:hypothetical protein [Leptospiraceae bacterium]MCP5479826.1 hypothetical protein [Spirochaetales bacterium]MCP5486216.1 hypothetical protein [Spirochaetales bacterium]
MLRWQATFLFAFLLAQPLLAQTPVTEDQRFNFSGSIFSRAIFLARDLPLPSAPTTSGTRRSEQGYAEYYACQINPGNCPDPSREKEQQDFYSIRLRVDASYRLSPIADVLYGLEIGEIVFGRDERDRSGPGTGGQGSGRTNIETRQLMLLFHTARPDSSQIAAGQAPPSFRAALRIGVFPVSSPEGLVLAASGAGIRFDLEADDIDSKFRGIYIRSIDNAQIDSDSNGFSDENFSNINLGFVQWEWSRYRAFNPILYGLYRQDDDPSTADLTDTVRETSRVYWGGLYLKFTFGPVGLILHGVGNWGRFHRPLSSDPDLAAAAADATDPLQGFITEAVKPPLRRQYRINAGAGQVELSYKISDDLELFLRGAGGSGRIPGDTEPDGSSVEFRPDQFRVANSGFQITEIAVGSSGGYGFLPGGRLTGIVATGLVAKYNFSIFARAFVFELGFFNIDAYRTPTIDYNTSYTRTFNQNHPTNYLGSEWNTGLTWDVYADLTLDLRGAWFDAGSGYKTLLDSRYGDDIYEGQFSITHKF